MYLYVLVGFLISGTNGFLLDTLAGIIPQTVCYVSLGCFSNGYPFLDLLNRPLSLAPESPDKIQTRFLLYTRANPTIHVEEALDPALDQTITGSHYSDVKHTKIIVHGFQQNGHSPWVQNATKELLIHEDFNVIAVDWHRGAVLPYSQAASNTRVVGAQLAQLVNKLINITGSSPANFHIIGHSLGAHVAGYAGERIVHLGRITGLDPASPYFENMDIKARLDPSDADFVDVIHTDAGGTKNLGLGATQAMGHLDFYPNGGERQPGCPTDAVDKLGSTVWSALTTLFDFYVAEEALSCSHERSNDYFIESINSQCPFEAFVCPSIDEFRKGHCINCYNTGCARMGYHANQQAAQGTLYLNTDKNSTFCEYNYIINISTMNNFDGEITLTLIGSNGTIGPVQLMTNNEIYQRNETISKLFTSRTDIGHAQSLTLHYEKINVPFISGFYPDDWQVLGISVWHAETQTRDSFCAYHKEIDNHNSTTFVVRGHCT